MRERRGFTLIEILVVLSLLGVLMGLSAGFVMRAGKGNLLIQTSNSLANLLASARAQSYGNTTAYVTVESDADGNTELRAYRNRASFTWHCEDLERASELDVIAAPGAVTVGDAGLPSRDGRNVVFPGGAAVKIRNVPWLQWRDGFTIACRILPNPQSSQSKMRLFQKGKALQVNLLDAGNGRYDVELIVDLDRDAKDEGAGPYQTRTGYRGSEEVKEWQGPILPGRWYDLRVTYDRNQLAVYVDDSLRAVRTERRNRMRPDRENPLEIGSGYQGGFDTLVIGGIFEDDDDRYVLSDNVRWIDADGKPLRNKTMFVHFRNRGLDLQHHTRPVEFFFELDEGDERGARRVVGVSMSGETYVKRPDE